MNIKIINRAFFILASCMFWALNLYAQPGPDQIEQLNGKNVQLKGSDVLHLTAASDPFGANKVDISSPDAWLYLDNIRPTDVLSKYAKNITISGKPFKSGAGGNGRIAIYKQGSLIIPRNDEYQPLEAFTEPGFKGASLKYGTGKYYTNMAAPEINAALALPLKQEKSIRSFKLKKGYMATVAIQPDGLGYSRIFIADSADLEITSLPVYLDKQIAFIRILPWQWPSKKGWCGGRGGTVLSNGANRQDNEIELTQSTWFYSWGSGDPFNPNAEFVPMKWGLDGSMKMINDRTDVTHLMGYNEPNRPDQSSMSVAQALSQWPQLMKSGLRLGSPSVSDNSRLEDWLYAFIDECDKRNYRVDFVNVHAYWGAQQMPSPEAWYQKLKEIHLRTGRPIWITEWNIGANWTRESWPSGKEEQFQKHLRDLQNILKVLDTASFVERYSIYNWVEDKRAMIIDSVSLKTEGDKQVPDKLFKQAITPAGMYYRDNKPGLAFNSRYEVIKEFQINTIPVLSYKIAGEKISLNWTVGSSQEMVKQFTVEKAADNGDFKEVKSLEPSDDNTFTDVIDKTGAGKDNQVYYRIRATDVKGDDTHLSNTVSCHFVKNNASEVTVANITAITSWASFLFADPYPSIPYVIFGTPTNRNKSPQTHRIRDLSTGGFEFKLDLWKYLKNLQFTNNDTIAAIIVPGSGKMELKGLNAAVGKAENIKESWTTVKFEKPFAAIPVVFASQVSSGDEATTSVRIKNVTREGFDVMLQYEAAYNPFNVSETIHYLAITPGKGSVNGKKMQIGLMDGEAVGDFFNAVRVDFDGSYKSPAFFSAMQSESDGITSALRIKSWGPAFAEVFKEKEVSKGAKPVQKESLGWMVIETK